MDQILSTIVFSIAGAVIPGILISLFAKKYPKDETFKKYVSPFAEFCAVFIHNIMIDKMKLKAKTEADIEEGIFKTLAYWLDGFIHTFIAKWNELIFSRTIDKK